MPLAVFATVIGISVKEILGHSFSEGLITVLPVHILQSSIEVNIMTQELVCSIPSVLSVVKCRFDIVTLGNNY